MSRMIPENFANKRNFSLKNATDSFYKDVFFMRTTPLSPLATVDAVNISAQWLYVCKTVSSSLSQLCAYHK